ncbi:MAG: LacI family DNA-binding transcriptional regulator [Haloechinothrix sp.]
MTVPARTTVRTQQAPGNADPVMRRLGLAVALDANPHTATLTEAIVRAAEQTGCRVLIADTQDSVDSERAAVRELRDRGVDGLLLSPCAGDDAVINHLLRVRVPTVLVDRMASRGDVDQVGVENVQATCTLVRHLAGRGHRRIGLISGADGLTASDERALGYRLGLGRAGLPYDPRLVAGAGATSGGAAQATGRLLDRDDPPTGLVVASESMLIGAQFEVHRRGIVIGSELAIVGYGDPAWARSVDPPLTTMAPPIAAVGHTAVQMLIERAGDPERPVAAVRLPPRLMHRASCGCWPADWPPVGHPVSPAGQPRPSCWPGTLS